MPAVKMGMLLPKARPSINMRNPLIRAVMAAGLIAIIVLLTWNRDSVTVHTRFLEKTGFTAHTSSGQRPLDTPTDVLHSNPKILDLTLDEAHEPTSTHEMNCDYDMPHLTAIKERYGLDDKFHYTKRYVRFKRTPGVERKSMNRVHQDLLAEEEFTTVQIGVPMENPKCPPPLEIKVPKSGLPSTVNASDFMFGVSTTYGRFMDPSTTPINEWIFWLTDSHGRSNGGKLLLMLLDASDEELQEVANLLGDVGIDVDVYHSDSSVEMAVRYLTLVPTLFTHRDAPLKKWLVTCDDDTFFPSMHGLIAKITSLDHTREMYVGTLSEDAGALDRHGSQAFGGGGVFISLPLAERITSFYYDCTSEAKVLESNSGWGPQGDILLRKCIYEHTDTRLTSIWDLWQLDFYGDPSGFYEWGIKPLSVHHYRGGGWHIARPGQITKIAHTCGEDCSMMRFLTDDDFIISGYSVAHYPNGVTFDWHQMEGTLNAAPENKGWNLDYMFGPQRPSLLQTGKKIAWELQESDVRSDGSILQTYTRKKDDWRWKYSNQAPMSNIDGVIELIWIPA